MLRGIYGDRERFIKQYFSQWKDGAYFTGDGAKKDEDGFYWLLGRVDDVLNVAGHRIGTMEVESALVDHPRVAEAAVVGRAHEIKGQAITAFVTLKEGTVGSAAAGRRTESARRQEDRRDRAARGDPVHGGSPEDALRQNHAPPPARHRRRPRPRRYDDAGRSKRRVEAERQVRRGSSLGLDVRPLDSLETRALPGSAPKKYKPLSLGPGRGAGVRVRARKDSSS